MHLDIAVGEAKVDEEGEREHVKDLAGKVKDLNTRLGDIRREQQFQREREAQFRDLSEATNSKAVWWSVVQLVVLLGTCAWQLRHLRMFFESKKLYVRPLFRLPCSLASARVGARPGADAALSAHRLLTCFLVSGLKGGSVWVVYDGLGAGRRGCGGGCR